MKRVHQPPPQRAIADDDADFVEWHLLNDQPLPVDRYLIKRTIELRRDR